MRKGRDRELINFKMAIDTRVSGRIIRNMVKESFTIKTESCI